MIVEKAYGKINLGLEVLGKRDDGFHELRMIMLPISTCDTLWIEEADRPSIIMNEHLGPIEDNIIYKVYFDIKKRFNIQKNASIYVDKVLPVGAGLGGGSSDAAATLKGLIKLWGISISDEELLTLALSYGSDVPFFLKSVPSFVTGRGEIIEPIHFPYELTLVCHYPGYATSTKEVFMHYQEMKHPSRILPFLEALKVGKALEMLRTLENDLQKTSSDIAVQKGFIPPSSLQDIFMLKKATTSLMSGSGSTVYGVFLEKETAEFVLNDLKIAYPNDSIWMTTTIIA
ncbi:MAG: 4-(cytidine 5'-diphospho)-2-C-methyl-D-erythritol kinase [Bacilli bacterium]|nr:4-(cytidine 5'-diphospho)-2-C-methyl-D-erythritol kinase [Bacilli bacterium]